MNFKKACVPAILICAALQLNSFASGIKKEVSQSLLFAAIANAQNLSGFPLIYKIPVFPLLVQQQTATFTDPPLVHIYKVMNAGQYAQAEELLVEYINHKPRDPWQGRRVLAFVRWELGKPEAAIAAANSALTYHDRDISVLEIKGKAQMELGQAEEALKTFSRAVELNTLYWGTYALRAWALHALGRRKEELEDLEKAAELKPDLYKALAELAKEAQEHPKLYMNTYEEALKRNLDAK